MGRKLAEALIRTSTLTLCDWRYLSVAAFELLLARIRHALQPAGYILQKLQQDNQLSQNMALPLLTAIELRRLSWAIAVTSARVPWRSDCLLQVMAAHRWLRRHHCRAYFCLGVAKGISGNLAAHAWLRCDDIVVIGGDCDEFTALIGSDVEKT